MKLSWSFLAGCIALAFVTGVYVGLRCHPAPEQPEMLWEPVQSAVPSGPGALEPAPTPEDTQTLGRAPGYVAEIGDP